MFKQLRYGRGLDNRKLKSTGFEFAYSTRETVLKFAEHLRLRSVLRGVREPYRYERDVEEFLRRSPSVRNRTHPEEAPATSRPLLAASRAGMRPRRPRPSRPELGDSVVGLREELPAWPA
jgi:hypothetical protein